MHASGSNARLARRLSATRRGGARTVPRARRRRRRIFVRSRYFSFYFSRKAKSAQDIFRTRSRAGRTTGVVAPRRAKNSCATAPALRFLHVFTSRYRICSDYLSVRAAVHATFRVSISIVLIFFLNFRSLRRHGTVSRRAQASPLSLRPSTRVLSAK